MEYGSFVQAGALGVLTVVIILGFRFLAKVFDALGSKIDRLYEGVMYMASVIVDHKARHGDETPPEMPTPRRGTPRA